MKSSRRDMYTPRGPQTTSRGSTAGIECAHCEKPGEFWCSTCSKGLCSGCKSHHHNIGALNKHILISIVEFRKLRNFVTGMKEFCGLHGKKLDHFCNDHNCACCAGCLTTKHSKCDGVASIDINLTELKTPKMLTSLEAKGQKLILDIQSIKDNRKENIKNIETQRRKIQKDIEKARQTINAYLDKIERDTLVSLTVTEQKQRSELDDIMLQFETKEANIRQINQSVSSLRNFGADSKTFLATCEMNAKLAKEEKSLQKLYEDERLKQRELELKFNPVFASLYNEVKSFGDIVVKKDPVRIVSARLPGSHKSKKSNDVQEATSTVTVFGVRKPTCLLNLRRNISIQKGRRDNYITSCAVMPTGKFVFVDCSDKRLIVCHADGSHNRDISLPNQPWDLAVIGKQRVAVTVPLEHAIFIIDTGNGKILDKFNLGSQCYGITHSDGTLVVIFHREGIKFFDLEGLEQYSLPLSVSNVWYVATFDEKIIYSEWNTHTIICCDMDGKTLWKFKDENLRNPRAVTCDEFGHIYVTGRWSHNVIAISPDGKQSKILLSKDDGLNCPTGLFYEKDKKRLLICTSFQGSVSYYEVSVSGAKSTTCSIS